MKYIFGSNFFENHLFAGTGLGGLQARLSEDQLKRETEISFGNKQVIQRGHRESNLSPVTQKPGIRRALLHY